MRKLVKDYLSNETKWYNYVGQQNDTDLLTKKPDYTFLEVFNALIPNIYFSEDFQCAEPKSNRGIALSRQDFEISYPKNAKKHRFACLCGYIWSGVEVDYSLHIAFSQLRVMSTSSGRVCTKGRLRLPHALPVNLYLSYIFTSFRSSLKRPRQF